MSLRRTAVQPASTSSAAAAVAATGGAGVTGNGHSHSPDLTSSMTPLPLSNSAAAPDTAPSASPRVRSKPHSRNPSRDLHKSTDLLVNNKSKWRSAWTRTYTTVGMLVGFVALIRIGHWALLALLFTLQMAMFSEIKALSRVLSSKRALPSFRPLHWYWFCSSCFFTYGRIADYYFHLPIPYHTFISFSLYVCGLLLFVFSLKKGYYKYQFETFAWIHLTLILIVVQSTFIVVNMFQGLIWFILPALLIISNDCWAYIFGFFFGRTPLIRLSPKKTWEGFLGALVMTVVTGWFLAAHLSHFQSMICPKTTLALYEQSQCRTPPVFELYEQPLPAALVALPLVPASIIVAPVQFHALILALFASVIAPFGGFFASGFKRAFHVKDFGESIPGHGGVTDRMDCQIMMGFFVWVYYWTFISKEDAAVRLGKAMKLVDRMDNIELTNFYHLLASKLVERGLQSGQQLLGTQ